jgi:hypothetical protein
VSQAGAGGLLLSVALVELWLAFWAAGWWHRSAALLVVLVGAALLLRAIAAALPPRSGPAPRAERRPPASRLNAPARVALVE